jgi:hypothetical protein
MRGMIPIDRLAKLEKRVNEVVETEDRSVA